MSLWSELVEPPQQTARMVGAPSAPAPARRAAPRGSSRCRGLLGRTGTMGCGSASASASHCSNSAGGSARSVNDICQWLSPQYSAQRPTQVPGSFTYTSIWLSIPGMRSRFSRNSGTQNEWMTSRASRRKRTVVPTGSTSSAGSSGVPDDGDAVVGVLELPLPLEPDHVDRRSGSDCSAVSWLFTESVSAKSTPTSTSGTTV